METVADSSPPAIVLDRVERRFGGVLALGPITLAVPAGRTLALIGPSGCGKSTLLRLVVGLLVPDRGTVSIAGVPLTSASMRSARLAMGYVIQEGGLFPHLTGFDNAALLARDLGRDAGWIAHRVAELAALCRLPEELLGRYPGQLSGGQRQRLALVRALMLDPEVLLLDEPLGALDPMIRAHLQDELRELFQKLSKTVVLVTHDLAEAAWLTGELVLLREGQVVQRGTAADLDERPAEPFVTEFLRAQRPRGAGGVRA